MPPSDIAHYEERRCLGSGATGVAPYVDAVDGF